MGCAESDCVGAQSRVWLSREGVGPANGEACARSFRYYWYKEDRKDERERAFVRTRTMKGDNGEGKKKGHFMKPPRWLGTSRNGALPIMVSVQVGIHHAKYPYSSGPADWYGLCPNIIRAQFKTQLQAADTLI